MTAQDIPHQDKWCPRAFPPLQQQSRPPPANALPSQIAGVQRRKEPRFLSAKAAKASGTTIRIYLGAARWTNPPLGRSPGLGAGSSLIRCPHPLDLRALQLCALEPRGSAWGSSTLLLRPGAICRGEGRGMCLPLQPPPASSLSSNQFQTTVYSPGAGDFPPTPHTGLSLGPETPFPPCS